MSLQERTLVLRNFDSEKTTKDLITELFIQAGPVKNVVIRPDHAFVEFEDMESVGYAKALLDGVEMFGMKLELQPKARLAIQMKYVKLLNDYIAYDRRCKEQQTLQQQQLAFYQPQPHAVAQQFPALPTMPSLSNATSIYGQPQSQPVLQGPTYPIQPAANPQLFNLNPFIQTAQFIPPDPWTPTAQSTSQVGNPARRSWSFGSKGPGQSGNFNRNHQLRNSDRRRR